MSDNLQSPGMQFMDYVISHEYANIDEEIIVSVINDDLQPLKDAIEALLKK